MMKSAIVGAAAIFASALATPAMAQPVITDPGKCAQYYPNANCQNLGAGNPYTGSYQRRAYPYGAAYHSYNRRDDDRGYRSGFWPGGVAAGAVGTAAAVATAPFAAFDNGYPGGYYGQTYAQRNGFVCTPGTWYRGDDGRRHFCR
jgi:hypothetical protein